MRRKLALAVWMWLWRAALAHNAETVGGEWLVTRDAYGSPLYHRMTPLAIVSRFRLSFAHAHLEQIKTNVQNGATLTDH